MAARARGSGCPADRRAARRRSRNGPPADGRLVMAGRPRAAGAGRGPRVGAPRGRTPAWRLCRRMRPRLRRVTPDASRAAGRGANRTEPLVPGARSRRLARAREPWRPHPAGRRERRCVVDEPGHDGGHHGDGRQFPADRHRLGGTDVAGRPVRRPRLAVARRESQHGVAGGRGARARPPGRDRRGCVPQRHGAVRRQPDLARLG